MEEDFSSPWWSVLCHAKYINWTRLEATEDTHLVTPILPKLHPSDDLLVNEIGGHVVLTRIVPRGEDLLPEEEPPRRVALLCSLLFGILLTLRHSIHHMVIATPQRRDLVRAQEKGGIHLKADIFTQRYLRPRHFWKPLAQPPARSRLIFDSGCSMPSPVNNF